MRVLLAGGGTAGHINPALAIAQIVRKKQPDAEILFVGRPEGMEARLVPQAGYNYATMNVAGFQRKISAENIRRNIQALSYLLKSGKRSKEIVKDFKPDIAIGTGGYVSGPIIRKAALAGVPVLIHEQNAFPGVTTKMLSKYAKRTMLAVADAQKHLGADVKTTVTGNPVRSEILTTNKNDARRSLGISSDLPVVVSFGGSLGARTINNAVLELIKYNAENRMFYHIHAYGQYGAWVPEEMKKAGIVAEEHPEMDIREYIDNMPEVLAAADLVICRAGAITLSELQAQAKASILVPSPNVAENHQYHNAMAMVDRDAAVIIEDKDLTGSALIREVCDLIGDEEYLRKIGENAGKMAIRDSAERIYSIIQETLGNH